ncbi:hypothetical protein GGH92_005979, partial [Coemansia sp. RSA 2673]
MKTIGEERRNEMVDLYGKHHVHDNDSILNLTEPLKLTQQGTALTIADEAVNFLEANLRPKSTRLETTAPPPKQVKGGRGAKKSSSTSSSTAIGIPSELSSLGDMTMDEKEAEDDDDDEDDDDSARIAHIDEMRD